MARLENGSGRAGRQSAGDTTSRGENAAPGLDIQMRGPVCELCGGPVPRASKGRPRRQHPACTAFKAYLAAAAREAQGIAFVDAACARGARRLVLRLANRLPTRWQRARDSRGRFLPLKGSR